MGVYIAQDTEKGEYDSRCGLSVYGHHAGFAFAFSGQPRAKGRDTRTAQ